MFRSLRISHVEFRFLGLEKLGPSRNGRMEWNFPVILIFRNFTCRPTSQGTPRISEWNSGKCLFHSLPNPEFPEFLVERKAPIISVFCCLLLFLPLVFFFFFFFHFSSLIHLHIFHFFPFIYSLTEIHIAGSSEISYIWNFVLNSYSLFHLYNDHGNCMSNNLSWDTAFFYSTKGFICKLIFLMKSHHRFCDLKLFILGRLLILWLWLAINWPKRKRK